MKRIVFILAGGRSQRMDGRDKALASLGGARLIDRVIDRLAPQADRLLISAPDNYGTDLEAAPDRPGAPDGPAGGIYSLRKWVLENEEGAPGFFTAPVDGPFAPANLIQRLGETGRASIASDGARDHPTFAYWRNDALSAAWPGFVKRPSISLTALSKTCKARRVIWRDRFALFNINTEADLDKAVRIVAGVKSE